MNDMIANGFIKILVLILDVFKSYNIDIALKMPKIGSSFIENKR